MEESLIFFQLLFKTLRVSKYTQRAALLCFPTPRIFLLLSLFLNIFIQLKPEETICLLSPPLLPLLSFLYLPFSLCSMIQSWRLLSTEVWVWGKERHLKKRQYTPKMGVQASQERFSPHVFFLISLENKECQRLKRSQENGNSETGISLSLWYSCLPKCRNEVQKCKGTRRKQMGLSLANGWQSTRVRWSLGRENKH